MKYTGPVYRPPVEHDSLLLQVTVGCAHNKCTFCTMYKDVKFQVESIEQVEADLKEARQHYANVPRIFLVNGDAFVLSADRLKAIAAKIIEYFPECRTIAMYASIRNIMSKSDQELNELRELRINDLYVGLETGTAEVITKINKGYTLKDAYEQLERLNNADISFISLLMLGIAGRGRGLDNAVDTALLLNATKPKLIIVCTSGIFPGSELERETLAGRFVPATELEVLEEEMKLLECLELDDVPFFGLHPTNIAPIYGNLPQDKAKMIAVIKHGIENADRELLNKALRRASL